MKNTNYYKSGQHTSNALKSQQLALISNNTLKKRRVDLYYLNPILCLTCNIPIPYEKKRTNKFCSRTCSTKYNNIHRSYTPTIEHKQKTSSKLKGRVPPNKGKPSHKFNKIQFLTCKSCNKLFYVRNWYKQPVKTCGSPECKIYASTGNRPYKNGKRKLFNYFNKHQDKEILLESSWEFDLAHWLDDHHIVWVRPKYIKWFDHINQKHRLYYPDFYLPENDLYLDPKNPWGMKNDEYKMHQISQVVKIIYGDINYVKSSIKNHIANGL